MPSHTPAEREKRRKEKERKSPTFETTTIPLPSGTPPEALKKEAVGFKPLPRPEEKEEEIAPTKEAPVQPKTPTFELIREEETGNITGIRRPSGEVILDKDTALHIAQRAKTEGLPVVEGAQAQFERQQGEFKAEQSQQALQLLQSLRNQQLTPEQLSQIQPATIDFLQAAIEGGTGALFGGVGGRALVGGTARILTGAAAGTGVGLGVAGILAGFGAIRNARKEIRSQLEEQFDIKVKTLNDLKPNLDDAINLASIDPNFAVKKYVEVLNRIRIEYASLKSNEQRFILKGAGADVSDELIEFENFFSIELPNLDLQLAAAIQKQNI